MACTANSSLVLMRLRFGLAEVEGCDIKRLHGRDTSSIGCLGVVNILLGRNVTPEKLNKYG